ncbi:hypothetical protein BD311DRAFT_50624 [Dichomitus squalens]|uniref:Uncharacterized protein n=1 Tax=Dichomitus squalens TaxID=114155 RepID=A0A4Q9M9W4_9APHY|nr:hypothetical protein BD311DRAFT_50624 [Dichomitus squalens]
MRDGTEDGVDLSPPSPTWSTSSLDEEIPIPFSHTRRHSSPHLEVYSPGSLRSPSPSTRSRHGSLSEYHTPEPLPSPFLSPSHSHAPRLPRTSLSPYHSPHPSHIPLPANAESYSPPQSPHLHASPLPSPETLHMPSSLPGEFPLQPQAPSHPFGHVHAPSPVRGYRRSPQTPF